MKRKIHKNKGFTLVELIVILVILAILAAILVPALLGYIDKSNKQQLQEDGSAALTAVRSAIVEDYAKNDISVGSKGFANLTYTSALKNHYFPLIQQYYDFTAEGYTLANLDVTKHGQVICFHMQNTRGDVVYDEIQFLDCTINDVDYQGEWIVNTWHGTKIQTFIDPAIGRLSLHS